MNDYFVPGFSHINSYIITTLGGWSCSFQNKNKNKSNPLLQKKNKNKNRVPKASSNLSKAILLLSGKVNSLTNSKTCLLKRKGFNCWWCKEISKKEFSNFKRIISSTIYLLESQVGRNFKPLVPLPEIHGMRGSPVEYFPQETSAQIFQTLQSVPRERGEAEPNHKHSDQCRYQVD